MFLLLDRNMLHIFYFLVNDIPHIANSVQSTPENTNMPYYFKISQNINSSYTKEVMLKNNKQGLLWKDGLQLEIIG